MPTYFITFTTYGTRLHGSEKGSVDRHLNRPGDPLVAPDERLEESRQQLLKHAAYTLDEGRRELTLAAVRQHAEFRGWGLLAAHVRTTHVHVVVTGDRDPVRMMDEFKAYASRALNAAGSDPPDTRRWTRHGSTRWLNTGEAIDGAVRYVAEEQGERMALYVGRTTILDAT